MFLSIKESLPKWLKEVRWWPWRNEVEVDILEVEELNKALFLKISSGLHKTYLPLIKVNELPEGIPLNRAIVINGGKFVEAEYTPHYLQLLWNANFLEIKECVNLPTATSVIRARPITLDSSNAVAIHTLSNRVNVVVKSYRKLPKVSIEPIVLEALATSGYNYVPRLYYIVKWGEDVITLIMEYVESLGDGGTPFYKDAVKYFNEGGRANTIKLASQLGVEVSELHKTLIDVDKDFFKPEVITDFDLRKWEERVERYAKSIYGSIEKMEVGSEWLKPWIKALSDVLPKAINSFRESIDVYRDLVKARIHQDLHLSQFLYTPSRGFILTDFEGEPARSEEEKLYKEPCLRDLGTLVRSFHYLTTHIIISRLGLNRATVPHFKDPLKIWRHAHLRALVHAYLMNISPYVKKAIGLSKLELISKIHELIKPWIIEKALYEANYELLYRPHMLPIPTIGLLTFEDETLSLIHKS
ncbi:MAG: hypothetical protein N3E36_04485 [Sulfolobales archaeon]|nr:hypothetical protein [Sulfolobales archaeon]MCX8199272.1 hypothetical protein [Sulfolobales archaeon]MDW8170414.1 hypothetical protein [Desulfurococcaceae archaeon]